MQKHGVPEVGGPGGDSAAAGAERQPTEREGVGEQDDTIVGAIVEPPEPEDAGEQDDAMPLGLEREEQLPSCSHIAAAEADRLRCC